MSTSRMRQPEVPPRQAAAVFIVFLAAQLLDGLLTFWGVSVFGVGIEANVLIATSIDAIGPHRAVVSAKLLACVCGYILYRTASHTPLAMATGFCTGVAVVPWLAIAGSMLITP